MIFENNFLFIEREMSQIPWLKIFTKAEFKELSQCDESTLGALFKMAMICEKALIEFYKPDKINLASFANYVPRVHIHVMARFRTDAYFPECMWGKQQREMVDLKLPEFEEFEAFLIAKIQAEF